MTKEINIFTLVAGITEALVAKGVLTKEDAQAIVNKATTEKK